MAQQRSVMIRGQISVAGGPPRPCVVTGLASELGIWGGPIIPPSGDHPDNTLPGDLPHPEHPIVIIPPGAIDGAHPEHPIFLPVYPAHPIELPPEQPAEPGFQWVYTEQFGWVLDPLGGGKPRPLPPGR